MKDGDNNHLESSAAATGDHRLWRPIETAPRATSVLIHTGDVLDDLMPQIGIYLGQGGERGTGPGWHIAWDHAPCDDDMQPKFWMPLPSAPSVSNHQSVGSSAEESVVP